MTRVQASLVGAAILGGVYGGALAGLIALAVEKEWHLFSAWGLHLQGSHYAWGRLDRSTPLGFRAVGLALLAGGLSGILLTPALLVLTGMGRHFRLISVLGKWGGLVVGGCAALVLVFVLLGRGAKIGLACLGTPATLVGAIIGMKRGEHLAAKVHESLGRQVGEPSS